MPSRRSYLAWSTVGPWASSTSAIRNCLEDRLQDSLFHSTEHAEVNSSRQIDRLLSHGEVPHLWRDRVRSVLWSEV